MTSQMHIGERIDSLKSELGAMGVNFDSYTFAKFYRCAQMVKVFGIDNLSQIVLPDTCVSKKFFLRKESELHSSIERLTVSVESLITEQNKSSELNPEIEGNLMRLNLQLDEAYRALFHLHQTMPIDEHGFYEALIPKVDELMSLCRARSEHRLSQQF
jgi:hypothetical protein